MATELKKEEENMDVVDPATTTTTSTPTDTANTEQKPLTKTQAKEELMRMKKHYKDCECDFLEMDMDFRERYLTLEKEYARAVHEENSYIVNVCAERNVPSQSRDVILKILTGTDPEGSMLQQTMVDFVGATAADSRIANERYAQEKREKEELQQQLLTMRKQMEQGGGESFNMHNKRARPAPYTYTTNNTQIAPLVKREQQASPQQPKKNTDYYTPADYTYMENLKVHAKVPLNNEKLNHFLKTEVRNPYEKKTEYAAKSATTYNYWQQLDLLCNSATPVKMPQFG